MWAKRFCDFTSTISLPALIEVMVRCHECESEVAENDLFCPYCGISVPRASKPAPAADDSMESTVMMPIPNGAAAATRPKIPDTDPGTRMDSFNTISDQPLTTDFSDELFNAPSTASPQPPTVDEIPIPAILANPDEFSKAAASLRESQPGNPAAVAEPAGAEVPPAPVNDFHQARTLEDIEGDEGHAADLPAPTFKSTEGEAIAKPADDLVLPEASVGMYDSVRIVENRPGGSQDDVATRIQSVPTPSSQRTPEHASNFASPPAAEPRSEPKPYTAPNIGAGDTDGKKAAKLKPLSEGAILNSRYEIIRKIGGGGMGAVYLAGDNNLGGVLRAVKEMVQAHIEEDQQEKAILDFKRESMILSTLDHPSIPTIFDYFYDEAEGRFYLVMKYISGGDLASRLRAAPEGKIDEHTVTEWAVQLADVLDYLHTQPSPIVYRDLKPSNIMIDGNTGRVMLIDFGIARSISQKQEKGVTAVGTMGYAPPELFSGNVEPRSDIYSLGSTMFHLMTGADPQSNPLLIFDFQKNPRPRQINPRLSDQMERILMRAVEYSAESRFRTAAEMKQILQDHLAKLKTGNLTYGITEIPVSVSLANQTVFCGFCGQRIVATDLFCAFCGAKQPIAQQGVHSEIYAQPVWTARLVVEGTNDLNAPTYSLQKEENLVGRRDPMSNIFPEVDLSKYDPQTKISRRHARIWREGGSFMVEDLGSSNGTTIATTTNDSVRLMPRRPHVLTSGDKIRIGDTTLHFVVG